MLNSFKKAFYNVVGNIDAGSAGASAESVAKDARSVPKFAYGRPHFLQRNDDEVAVSADHGVRPIIVPRDNFKLPWKTGYAETINAGKSTRNEDQASVHILTLQRLIATQNADEETGAASTVLTKVPDPPCQAVYFGLFDGHAGSGAAVVASHTLHRLIHEKLLSVSDLLLPTSDGDQATSADNGEVKKKPRNPALTSMYCSEEISVDSLIIGALEAAFWEMDQQIEDDRLKFKVSGGCTALVGLFLLGKLYVANAGDSRAVLVKDSVAQPMSNDFTPETEKQRIRYLALQQPRLLGGEYTSKEFIHRPTRKDIGTKMLYRDAYMTGWTMKTVSPGDLRFPVVYGEGKRSRVLATIGVTRGFGDHDLKAQTGNVSIKPFLSPQPEVLVYDLCNNDISENDVLILGTDGLWDITSNEKAAEVALKSLYHFPAQDELRYRYRYTSAAQDLVMNSRGKLRDKNWRTADDKAATIDDISVLVVPLLEYKQEYLEWKRQYEAALQYTVKASTPTAAAAVANLNETVGSNSSDPQNIGGSVQTHDV